MKVCGHFLKARQLALYFQHYRDLPCAKREPVDAEEAKYHFACFKGAIDEYRSLDNSPLDYDQRTGHVLLAEDPCIGRPMQISYQGSGSEGRFSKLLLDEAEGGFYEQHFILADDMFHMLTVDGGKQHRILEAIHWTGLDPETAQRQVIKLGH